MSYNTVFTYDRSSRYKNTPVFSAVVLILTAAATPAKEAAVTTRCIKRCELSVLLANELQLYIRKEEFILQGF
jgi:hypothetical protein